MRVICVFDPRPFPGRRGPDGLPDPDPALVLPRLAELAERTGLLEWRELAEQLDGAYLHDMRTEHRMETFGGLTGRLDADFLIAGERHAQNYARYRVRAAHAALRLARLSAAVVPIGQESTSPTVDGESWTGSPRRDRVAAGTWATTVAATMALAVTGGFLWALAKGMSALPASWRPLAAALGWPLGCLATILVSCALYFGLKSWLTRRYVDESSVLPE
jgi:hypothetical protein